MSTTIVLADDHKVLMQGMRSLLQNEGYEVVAEACDGREAVRLCRTLKPQIVILDITMPGLNGLDAAQKIRKASPDTKVIILTMHDESPYVIEALSADVNAYVLK